MTSAELSSRITATVPAARRERLTQAAALAAERGWPLYLVGGFVRDLLLGLAPDDFDVVVEGDAPALAQALARRLGGTVLTHPAFGTATWTTPDGVTVDLATARTETYPAPAALPVVHGPAALRADLDRRDFSINALAVPLTPAGWGGLVDAHHGQTDLAQRIIRVLHPLSFQDDPTRLFRAVRYEQRLGGQIAPETLALMEAAGAALEALSADRLRHELELIFRERRAAAMLARLDELGVLRRAHPALAWGAAESAAAEVWPALPWPAWRLDPPPAPDAAWLSLLLRRAEAPARQAALRRINPSGMVATAVQQALDLAGGWPRPSQAVAVLDRGSELSWVAAYVARPDLRPALAAYLSQWRFVRSALTGHDLIQRGLPPGPDFKVWLGRLRAARLDGQVSDAAGEEALLAEWLAASRPGQA